MQPLNLLLSILLLLLLLSCNKQEEVLPEDPEQIRVLARKELRTSYGHISFDSLEYEGGRLSRKIYFHEGQYNSEKIYRYEGLSVQTFSNNNGEFDPELFQELKFDDGQRLQEVFIRPVGLWDYSYEAGTKKPSTSSGTFNSTYNFDAAGNLANWKLTTSAGSEEYVIEYDNKINPYQNLPNFEWDVLYFSQNNPVLYKVYQNGVLIEEVEEKYEYDQQGYPVRMVSNRDTTLFYYSHTNAAK